jgi:hypothetical protein
MSLGVLGTRGIAADSSFAKFGAGVRHFGFGSDPCVTPPLTQIPGSCWDKALTVPKINFKDCHAAAFRVAQDACKRRGEDNLCCINKLADQYAREMCADVCPEIMTSAITARESAEEPSDAEQSLLPVVLVGLAIVAGLSLIGGKR